MQVGLAGPGFAFWRSKAHGWDLWFWGLVALEVPDWYRWTLGLRVLDFDMAFGLHFDHYTTLAVWMGPFRFRLLYIDDLGGGITHEHL